MSSGECGKFLSVVTASIAAPLAPLGLLMSTEYIISRSFTHLEPVAWICIVLGYVAIVFFALPMHVFTEKPKPDLTLVLKLGAFVGGMIPMTINIPLVLFFSLDDTGVDDLKDILAYYVGGLVYGTVSGLVFWWIVYSWRTEEPKKD